MTSFVTTYKDRDWTVTDEHAKSSYGAPVLIGDDGQVYGVADLVFPRRSDGLGEVSGDLPPVYGWEIMAGGKRNKEDIATEEIRPILDMLTHAQKIWDAFEASNKIRKLRIPRQ